MTLNVYTNYAIECLLSVMVAVILWLLDLLLQSASQLPISTTSRSTQWGLLSYIIHFPAFYDKTHFTINLQWATIQNFDWSLICIGHWSQVSGERHFDETNIQKHLLNPTFSVLHFDNNKPKFLCPQISFILILHYMSCILKMSTHHHNM